MRMQFMFKIIVFIGILLIVVLFSLAQLFSGVSVPRVLSLDEDSALPSTTHILQTHQASFTYPDRKIKSTPQVSKRDFQKTFKEEIQQDSYGQELHTPLPGGLRSSGEHDMNITSGADIKQHTAFHRKTSFTKVNIDEKQYDAMLQNMFFTKAHKERKRIFPASAGRLGNHLFNLVSAYGIARTNNRRLVLMPKFVRRIESLLNITLLQVEVGELPPRILSKHVVTGIYNPALEHLEEKDVKLGTYIQSWRYFMPYEVEIRERLCFNFNLTAEAQAFLHSLELPSDSAIIGIHVRRGDFFNVRPVANGRLNPKPRYLEKAMAYFRSKYTNVNFVVCSDDIEWCKENLDPSKAKKRGSRLDYGIHFSPFTSAALDLTLLAQCNHSIMTAGTFGWWASWFAGGEVVYFNKPFREGSQLSKHNKAEDRFLPTWIGMDDT